MNEVNEMIYEVIKRVWTFDDCIVEEKEGNLHRMPYFDIYIERNGIKGHQNLLPFDKIDEYRRSFNNGESPLYRLDDGEGHVIGRFIRASKNILTELILKSRIIDKTNGFKVGRLQYIMPDGKRLTIYTSDRVEDDDTLDRLIDIAVSFSVTDNGITSPFDTYNQFFLEDE